MFLRVSIRSMAMVFLAALAIGLATVPSAHATGYATTVLHSFGAPIIRTDTPYGPLIKDSNGNFYVNILNGGTTGNGSVLELVNSSGTYTEKVLYSFTGGADGANPTGPLVMDAAGNLYGTAPGGGASNLGVVFELVNSSGTYTETVLHTFTTFPDAIPTGGLVRDATGNLYGTTFSTVFELVNSSGTYTEKVLDSVNNIVGGVLIDTAGNLYFSTSFGNGSVLELVNSSGTYTQKVLYSFTGGADGANPDSGLLIDSAGNLYGTTGSSGFNFSNGTVFELVNSSGTYTETTLYSFKASDRFGPSASIGLIRDTAGNLYGITKNTVFELVNSSGAFTKKLLHTFLGTCAGDGLNPATGLLMDATGNLYGLTSGGGTTGQGTLFELVSFTGQPAPTTITLTSSENPANAADFLALTATVTPSSNLNFIFSGTLTLSSGSVVLGSGPLGCGASLKADVEDAAFLGLGPNTITATYTPDTAAFAASSGTLIQTVNEPGVVLTNGNNTLNGNQTINGTVNATSLVGGSLDVGGGTPITEYVSTTQGITLPVLTSLACTRFTTAPVTGFTPGASDTIALGVPSSLVPDTGTDDFFLVYQAWETSTAASPTITIRVCNSGGARYAGGASGTLRVSIFKH